MTDKTYIVTVELIFTAETPEQAKARAGSFCAAADAAAGDKYDLLDWHVASASVTVP